MHTIRLSIIIPFYNVEQYIAQCLASVYDQDISEEEYEVICVDDCSPDGSRVIVEQYADKHANLKIVTYPKNRKLGGARNAGFDVAQGRYVWFVDSDDFVEKNVFSRLLSVSEKNNLDILHFGYAVYPNKQEQCQEVDTTDVMSGTSLFFDSRFQWDRDFITAWCKIYRRDYLIESHIRFAEDVMYEDNDYAICVFASANRAMHVNLEPYYYRQNDSSITRLAITEKHIKYWLDLVKRLHALKTQFVIENQDRRYIAFLNRFIRFEVEAVLDGYKKMGSDSRKQIKKDVLHVAQIKYKPYMSLKRYIKLRLGII